jgi:quinolinate synthase
LNTLEKVYLCLLQETPELLMDEELRRKAETPIRRMLEISATLGL